MQPGALGRKLFDNATLQLIAEKLRDRTDTFILHVTDGLSERVLRIKGSSLQLFSTGSRCYPSLPSYLLARGIVEPQQLESLLQESESTGVGLDETLVDRSAITRDEIDHALEKIARDALFDLVFWRGAHVAIHEENAPGPLLQALERQPLMTIDRAEIASSLESWSERWNVLQSSIHSDIATIVLTEFGSATLQDYTGHLHDCLVTCGTSNDLRGLWARNDTELPLLCEQLDELIQLDWVRVSPRIEGICSSAEETRATVETLERNLEIEPAALETPRAIVETVETDLDHDMARDAANLIGSHAGALITSNRFDEVREATTLLERLPGAHVEAREVDAEILCGEGDRHGASGVLAQVAERSSHESGGCGNAQTLKTPKGPVDPAIIATSSDRALKRNRPTVRLPRRISWSAVSVLTIVSVLGALFFLYLDASNPIQPGGSFGARTAEALQMSHRDLLPEPASATSNVGGEPAASAFYLSESTATHPVSIEEPDAAVGPSIAARAARRAVGKTERVVSNKVVARFATSESLELRNRWADQTFYELPGRPDEGWSIGYQGRVICQWQPGRPARVFRPPSKIPQVLTWKVPNDTAALAIGPDEFALRRGTHTIFYPYDGRATGGGETPLWTEGIYMGNKLLLQRPALTPEDRPEVWCLRHPDLQLLWTCTLEGDAAVFR